MKSKWIILTLTSLSVLGFILLDTAISTAAKYSAPLIVQSKFDADFTYDDIVAKGNTITVVHPIVTTNEGLRALSAEKLTVDYKVNWFGRNLELDIKVDNPDMEVAQNTIPWDELLSYAPGGLYRTTGKLAVNQGTIKLFADPNDAIETRNYSFACVANWGGDTVQAQAFVGCDLEKPSENSLEIVYSKSPSGITNLKLNAVKLDCKAASDLAELFAPGVGGWRAKNGFLDGVMLISNSPSTPFYAEGKWDLSEINLENSHLGISATIPETHINLLPGHGQPVALDARLDVFPALVGDLDLPKGCILCFEKEGEIFSKVELDKALIHLSPESKVDIDFQGWADNGNLKSKFGLSGYVSYPGLQKADADLVLDITHKDLDVSQIHLNVKDWGLPHYSAEFEGQKLGPPEFLFLQKFLGRYAPEWDGFKVYDGSVDGLLKIALIPSGIHGIIIEKFQARDLHCDFPNWEIEAGAGNITGQGSINLAFYSPYDTLEGNFHLLNGEIRLPGFNEEFLHFKNIQTDLHISKGTIRGSEASVELAGLKGSAQVDWGNPQQLVKLDLSGQASDLIPFVPESIQTAIQKQFENNTLKVNSTLKRHGMGGRVLGQILVKDGHGSDDLISFGFDLDKRSSNSQESTNYKYWDNLLPNFVKMAVPNLTKPIGTSQAPWTKKGLNIGDLSLENGWFEAQNLPLNKYVQPVLFKKHPFKLNGRSDCKGTFDNKEITIRYNGRNIFFELEPMTIEAEKIPYKEASTPEEFLPAFHYFEIGSKTNFGFIPIQNATYFDKISGLLFTDVEADLILDGEKFHIPNIQAYCCGVSVAGQVDADFSDPTPGVGDVDIYAHSISGKVSNIQQVLAHFDKGLFLLKLPLEGNFTSGPKGGGLHFCLGKGREDINGYVQGTVTDGEIIYPDTDASVKDLSFNIDIDTTSKKMSFTDFQGSFLLGSPKHVEEYVLGGKGIIFDDYVKNNGEFDLGISDKSQDVFRLAGNLSPVEDESGLPKIGISFDTKATRFGNLFLDNPELVLIDWKQIDSMHLGFNFRLSNFIHDLQRFKKTGFFFLSRNFLEFISKLDTITGELELSIDYDPSTSKFLFDLIGQDVNFDEYEVKKLHLNGNKRGKTWVVEQLNLDDLSIGAELALEDNVWKANFLGIRSGDSLLAGLNGTYNEQTQSIEGKVNLLEIDLAHLDEWKTFSPFINEFYPQGKLKGAGDFKLSKDLQKDKWNVDTLLDLDLNDVVLKGLPLVNTSHVSCHYLSGQSLIFRQLKTGLRNPNNLDRVVPLAIEKVGYDFGDQTLTMEGSRFSIQATDLQWTADLLHEKFPEAIQPKTRELISNIKRNGTANGSFYLMNSPASNKFRLSLEDNKYFVFGKEQDLRKFLFERDGDETKLSTQAQLNKQLIWLSMHSNHPSLANGELMLADAENEAPAYGAQPLQPLKIQWERTPNDEYIVSYAEGNLGGLNFHLMQDTSHAISKKRVYLTGEVQVDGNRCHKIFSDELAQIFKNWQVGSGYTLKGLWSFGIDGSQREDLDIALQGKIVGNGFQLKGYRFENLSGNAYYSPGHLQLTNILLTDPAAVVQIAQIDSKKDVDGLWSFYIPTFQVSDFTPSLMTNIGIQTPSKSNSLKIENVYVENIVGIAGMPETFTGSGTLNFVNPPKGSLQNTIFAIPAEILSRIGLNTGIMTPVKGTIQFDIKDAQFQISKFKDIYSDRKLSKFYLKKTPTPSYVDFDGNIFVQVRMKQYNLLFKLAELFTVTVKGNIKKPIYTLQRQQRFGKDKNVEEYTSDNYNP